MLYTNYADIPHYWVSFFNSWLSPSHTRHMETCVSGIIRLLFPRVSEFAHSFKKCLTGSPVGICKARLAEFQQPYLHTPTASITWLAKPEHLSRSFVPGELTWWYGMQWRLVCDVL